MIHSVFNTDHANPSTNKSSSYLDLSPLYGSSDQQVKAIRRNDGSGKLHEDVFADFRLLFMPPSTGALLILFCRNHNVRRVCSFSHWSSDNLYAHQYIAEKLLKINEFGTFRSLSTLMLEHVEQQDDELFNRARLVNCGWFTNVILGDYVGAILGLTRDGSPWRLNPLEVRPQSLYIYPTLYRLTECYFSQTMRESTHEFSPVGQGNVVSLEFNFLYRWHTALSVSDTTWTENLFTKLFDGKSVDEVENLVVGFLFSIHID